MNFDQLISPSSLEDFTNNCWGKAPLRITRNSPDYYLPLMAEQDLEAILYTASQSPGGVEELLEEERSRDCRTHARAMAAFREGKSLRIDAIQRFSYPLAVLARGIEQILGAQININLYLSPGGGNKALPSHFDTHDVFVVQLFGNKRWRLYESEVTLPLEFLPLLQRESHRDMRKYRLQDEKEHPSPGALTEEFVMSPGDFLYLPRGHFHDARTDPNEVSCHLTIGVQPVTYIDLLTVALARASEKDVRLRRPLPIGFATHTDARAEVAKNVQELVQHVPQDLDVSNYLSDLSGMFLRRHSSPLENQLLRPKSSLSGSTFTPTTRIRLRKGVVFGINSAVNPPQLSYGAKSFAMDVMYEPACRFMSKGHEFTVSDLPGGLSEEQGLALVQQLSIEGLLVGVEETEPQSQSPVADEAEVLRQPEWVPYKLRLGSSTVEWINLGTRPLREPFFSQTIQQVKADNPEVAIRTTSLNPLLQAKEQISPSGFIFHISRCGSTLLSNALRTIPETIVISEPQTIGGLLSGERTAGTEEEWSALRANLLRGIIHTYGRQRIGDEQSLILKFTSWNLLHIKTIREIWPDVPCVIVVRDPLEVAVSCMTDPPGWVRNVGRRLVRGKIPSLKGQRPNEHGRESFCAHVIGEFCRIAAKSAGDHCQIVDYRSLSVERIVGVAKSFGLSPSTTDEESIRASLSVYSKDVYGLQKFSADAESKKSKASETLQQEIMKWATPAYEDALKTEAVAALS